MSITKHEFQDAIKIFTDNEASPSDLKRLSIYRDRMNLDQLMEYIDITNDLALGESLDKYIDNIDSIVHMEDEFNYQSELE